MPHTSVVWSSHRFVACDSRLKSVSGLMLGNSLECCSTCCNMQTVFPASLSTQVIYLLSLSEIRLDRDIISSGNQPWHQEWICSEMWIHGKPVVSVSLRTGYHLRAAHLVLFYCVLCERGSHPWMWEPRTGIHLAPSNTISYIPGQSRRITWPRLLFYLVLSHTDRHCNMHPVTSSPFNSIST